MNRTTLPVHDCRRSRMDEDVTRATGAPSVERIGQIGREELAKFRDGRDRKAAETTMERGETLEADGYTFDPHENQPSIYTVAHPDKPGSSYTVNATRQTCTCPAFARLGFCKHVIGLGKALAAAREAMAKAAALLGPLLPMARPLSSMTPAERQAQMKRDFD